ncbi:MAG: beta-hydroxyacyl-ACP dehydratase [Planctomycetes bacterium]|nr:beta-hydroxyacyl-ACP dehydratase [Planctomycetota bacterium]
MRFTLIDQIVELDPGKKVTGLKSLSMAEEYLGDHFPGFPVMPGVLMLEAMTQAAAWLIRQTEDFAHAMVVLKEARNVKYGNFVEPGQTLAVTCDVVDWGERLVKFKTRGTVDGETVVTARLVLERFNLAETDPRRAETDQLVKQEMRDLFALVYREVGQSVERTPG